MSGKEVIGGEEIIDIKKVIGGGIVVNNRHVSYGEVNN